MTKNIMGKALNFFGLTTIKSEKERTKNAIKKAVESAMGEKQSASSLRFVKFCRRYNFKVVTVGVDEAVAISCAKILAKNEFNADTNEQDEFVRAFIPHLKQSTDTDLLK